MNNLLNSISNNKVFPVLSGVASIISLVLTIVLKDNIILWTIMGTQLFIILLIILFINQNAKIVGKLDNINMYVIGQTINLENNDEESGDYTTSDCSVVVLHSNLSQDKLNQQHKVILELRFPSQITMNVDMRDNMRSEEATGDSYKISIQLVSEITYVRLLSFSMIEANLNEFLRSSQRIDIKLSSEILHKSKNEYISIDV